jgi:hypothetical protein
MKQALQLLLFCFLILGCREIDDNENPEAIIESPLEGEIINTDSNLRLIATLTDNTGLIQYKITINGIDYLNDIGADSTLSIIYIGGVPGKVETFYVDQLIELDDTTFNGHYELTLSTLDIEGNESIQDTVLFQIENSFDSEPPVINAGGPTQDTLVFGDGFSPNGVIIDTQSLIYATIYIGKVNGSDTLHTFEFPVIQNNEVSFDSGQNFWQVDSTWSQGEYHVYYTAWDNYSGVSKSIPFYVKY